MNSADLVARLRATAGKGQCGPVKSEAADHIEALEARLAEAEAWKAEAMEVLRPFAHALDEAGVSRYDADKRENIRGRGPDLAITYGHLRAARRLVEKEDGRG